MGNKAKKIKETEEVKDKEVSKEYSKYILRNPDSFNLKHIFECGQCFRWNYDEEKDEYIGVVLGEVISVKEIEEGIDKKYIFNSTIKNNEELEKFIYKYFNLSLEYNKIKEEILNKNSINILNLKEKENEIDLEHNIALKEAIEYGYGIRILKQDLWETVVSYIISVNNNIPRIKKIIETLSSKYGKRIVFKNKEYYSFPTPDELNKVSIKDLRECGLGFRDKRVYDITKIFLKERNIKDSNINKLLDNKLDVKNLRNILLKHNGIGPKVADCILLFALNKYEIFPIDLWIRRVMNDIYFKKKDEKKLTNDEIIKFINRRYGKYSGIVQQYLFYWKRETYAKKRYI